MTDRYDVVLFGVTGFTGRQAAAWFDANAPEGLTWAIAARNPTSLAEVGASLESNPPQIVADATDQASIDAMVAQGRVILSTAGPFAKYGTPVVDAAVRLKSHYVDITGETPWVADLIAAYHDQAAADGTKIVPFCGFDSVPSDLGAWMMVDFIRREFEQPTRLVRTGFSISGGLNGGTLASALAMAESGEDKRVAHTQLLNPPNFRTSAERARSRDSMAVTYDEDLGRYTAPFMMAQINTRVVRRSNGLFHEWPDTQDYGEHFTYHECMTFRQRRKAWMVTAGLLAGVGLISTGVGRSLARRFGPKPGEGPSDEALAKGKTRATLVGIAEDGRKAIGKISYDGDPGNKATVLMVCCSALCLAMDEDLPGGAARGGVLTPASAMGDRLLDRLRGHAMEWSVQAA